MTITNRGKYMQFRGRVFATAFIVLWAVAPAFAAVPANGAYEQALEQVFQLTYGKELSTLNINKMVEDFRSGMQEKTESDSKECPAMASLLDEFADKEFRQTITAIFSSPELKSQIKDEMRKNFTKADLDAFLAFVESPAGAKFLEHEQATNVAVERALSAKADSLETSPEFNKMITDMTVKLVPVMMKCKK